ncbi:hypothetical protein NIES4101_73980 [Calothrix sp. NIES-4101]|nr:hypothetical protein NIES4101_73980 [Calothrix sp. NIES-4101]
MTQMKELDITRYIAKKNETLPEALLRLALLFQHVKPLNVDIETKKSIMANPELLPQYIDQQNIDDHAI